MKKSELKAQIKEEIIDILEDITQEDPKITKDRTAAIQDLTKAKMDLDKVMTKEGDDQDDGYVQHKYDDSVIDKYNVPVEPTAVFNEDATPKGEDFFYDYLDIGMSYLDGFGKKHSLDDSQLEKLGKKIVDQLYKGDIGKAYDAIVKRGTMNEDEDKEPSKADLKKEPLSKIGYKLADTQKEMKQIVKKYSAMDEGSEKEKLKDRLRDLNKIKKELESLLESKR